MNDKLFGYEDFSMILDKLTAMDSDPFDAWGINGGDLMRFLEEGAVAGEEEFEALNEQQRRTATMFLGFALGFQVAQEMQMRKEVEND
jgi:hypothetical protein